MARTVELGGKAFDIKAAPPAVFYFHEEFGTSLITDYAKMFGPSLINEKAVPEDLYESMAQWDWPSALRVAWALAKTANPNGFPPFGRWIGEFEYMNMGDTSFILEVAEEANQGLFRTRDQVQQQEQREEAAAK